MPPVVPLRRRVTVSGRVQGVGFRQMCAEEARRRDVSGWVRNRSSGSVEAVFEGPAAGVAAMVEWCRRGPGLASVTSVEVREEAAEGLTSFRIAQSD